jgi:predicted Zn finger-like uncharacterized protein
MLRTRCPTCETTFALTAEQLAARQGLVRCGRCSLVFHADKYLLETAKKGRKRKAARTQRKAKTVAKQQPPAEPRSRDLGTIAHAKRVAKADEDEVLGWPLRPEELVSPLLARLLRRKEQTRMGLFFWSLAILALSAVLVAQVLYFYSNELARLPKLEPWVRSACLHLGCEIRPRQNVELIELLRTSVNAHPTDKNALRVRLSMVNRAPFTQPYPLIEVTITDSGGDIVARRTFSPRQYLRHLRQAEKGSGMIPHVVIEGVLDTANPHPKAGGYEIRPVAR